MPDSSPAAPNNTDGAAQRSLLHGGWTRPTAALLVPSAIAVAALTAGCGTHGISSLAGGGAAKALTFDRVTAVEGAKCNETGSPIFPQHANETDQQYTEREMAWALHHSIKEVARMFNASYVPTGPGKNDVEPGASDYAAVFSAWQNDPAGATTLHISQNPGSEQADFAASNKVLYAMYTCFAETVSTDASSLKALHINGLNQADTRQVVNAEFNKLFSFVSSQASGPFALIHILDPNFAQQAATWTVDNTPAIPYAQNPGAASPSATQTAKVPAATASPSLGG